jgi:hypothetical protein
MVTRTIGRIGAAAEATARRRLTLQAIAGIVAFALGFWGWALKSPPGDTAGWLNTLFRTIQLITLQFPAELDGSLPWQLQVGRLAVPIVAFAASFNVVLGAITRPARLALLPFGRDHVIFFGQPRLSDAALSHLVSRGHRLVFVHPSVKSERLDVLEGLGITVVAADPFLPSLPQDLAVAGARAVLVATGNDVDNANLAILLIEAMTRRRSKTAPPVIAVEFDRESLAAELAATVDVSARDHAVRFHRLSPDRESLAIELAHHLPVLVAAAAEEPIHALVVGLWGGWEQVLSRLIVALQVRPDASPLVSLILDETEAADFETWRRARPDLPLVVEIEVVARGDGSPTDLARRIPSGPGAAVPSFVLVLRDDADALATALALHRAGAAGPLASGPSLVLVRQSREDRVMARLPADPSAAGPRLRPFGGLLREETLERLLDPKSERLPIALHARYLATNAARGSAPAAALAAWEALPETLRDADRAAADHLPMLLAAIGRSIDRFDAVELAAIADTEWDRLARIEHRRWCADRIDRGWRWAAVRDDAGRRHPCLVPWDRLDATERQKDVESVHTLLTLTAELAGHRR